MYVGHLDLTPDEASEVTSGEKLVLRTDVMYRR